MDSDQVDPAWPPPEATPDTHQPTAGRSLYLVAALAVLVCIAGAALLLSGNDDRRPAANPAPTSPGPTTPSATNPSAGPCGPDEAAAIAAALATVPPDRKTGKQWNRVPVASHYNPCADLSAVVLTVQDGTRSSPDLALMFHRGAFVGTATPTAYPFTDIEGPASTADAVVLTYRTGQSCDSCEDGTLTIVGFAWKNDKVQMLDTPPESLDSPP